MNQLKKCFSSFYKNNSTRKLTLRNAELNSLLDDEVLKLIKVADDLTIKIT